MRSLAVAVAGLAAVVGLAQADVVNIAGSVGNSAELSGATFAGTLDYTYLSGSAGTLVVSLMNSSASGVGGFLTGFVFNIASSDVGASATLTAGNNANFLNTGIESAAPYGTFMAGAALGADWLGGGSPVNGIAVGDTATFTFAVSALDASALSAASFMNGDNDFNFLVRFRGLDNGGSDKVPGVPAPGVMALLGLGGVLSTRRRR